MAAVIADVVAGLELLDNLLTAASTVSAAVKTAQANGQPMDWTTILGDEATAEAAVVDAINNAKAARPLGQ